MTDLNVDHITAPEVTPDQWAAARAWLEAEHPDLADMLRGEEGK